MRWAFPGFPVPLYLAGKLLLRYLYRTRSAELFCPELDE
jgi:hypothetical protein